MTSLNNVTGVVAVIGDGQLARMMQTEAIELGVHVRLLAGAPDASAAQVCPDTVVGDYTDIADLRRAAEGCDALTFDHEHVPNEHLDQLISENINVQPQPAALIHAQDKLIMRQRLADEGFPVPEFAEITSVAEATAFAERVGGGVCLKARRGGYDGHGVWFPADVEELAGQVAELLAKGVPLMAERKVSFTRELSALVARSTTGEVAAWPVIESTQRGGICVEAVAPAPEVHADLGQLATRIAQTLGVTGVLAVEMFEYRGDDGQLAYVINELAMRPHNTGHWTQDGSVTSQFEQHLRAVLGWPLGATDPLAPVTVMVNTLGADEEPALSVAERCAEVWRCYPQVKIHLYGKTYRAGRKLGHVNVTGTDLAEARRIAQAAATFLVSGRWDDSIKD